MTWYSYTSILLCACQMLNLVVEAAKLFVQVEIFSRSCRVGMVQIQFKPADYNCSSWSPMCFGLP